MPNGLLRNIQIDTRRGPASHPPVNSEPRTFFFFLAKIRLWKALFEIEKNYLNLLGFFVQLKIFSFEAFFLFSPQF